MKKVFKQIGKVVKWCFAALFLMCWLFFCGGLCTAMYDVATTDSVDVSRDSVVNTLASTEQKSKKKHSDRCLAITNDGTYCKRKAKPGYYYCWQHLKYYK